MKKVEFVKVEIEEPVYTVAEVAYALGVTAGVVSGVFRSIKSTRAGLTLDDVVKVIERRTRGDGLNFSKIEELRARLRNEKRYVMVERTIDDSTQEVFDEFQNTDEAGQ